MTLALFVSCELALAFLLVELVAGAYRAHRLEVLARWGGS